MTTTNVKVDREGAVATVTIDRPERLNALNNATLAELKQAFGTLAHDAEVRACVLTGSGEKAFVAGADISELAALSGPEAEQYALAGQALMDQIENLRKPVIAAIGGYALGGGLELALACTVRWAASKARLGLPETGLGLIPGFGGTQRLPRLVGRGRATEMILTGDPIDADQALSWGLVTRVLERDELLAEAQAFAARLADRPAVALRAALGTLGGSATMALEAALFGVTCASEDAAEGCQAFLEKREAAFRHR